MKLLDFIFSPIDQFFTQRIDNQVDEIIEERFNASSSQPGSGPLSDIVEGQAVMMSAKTVDEWKMAVLAATDPNDPNWSLLHDLHDNMWLDDHLASVIESRLLHTKSHPFKLVDDNDQENTELNWLLERPWFYDLIELALMSKFRGRKLIEMYEIHTEGDYIGELKTVEEIKQPYFNTKKGIITKNPGDSTGFNYREAPYKGFYIQAGKDMDLGMFTWMAPIVLAKKLGMGAWLDLIDKYGVPPLFISTDREDEGRLKQLFNAAMKFKRNNFMITRGNEKIEVPTLGANNIAPHESLQKRGDELISKRVLGGTGLTDEKGFVGSVEIQYKLAKDRFDSDKLFFEYFFNAEIKPRLVNLSPVYAGLKDHYFKWDNTEVMSVKDLIDSIVKLGTLYDIDLEWVAKVTGIPVTGIRSMIAAEIENQNKNKTPEEVQDSKKKKRELEVTSQLSQIAANYQACGCDDHLDITALDFTRFDQMIDTVARQLHEGKLKPSDLNQSLISETYKELNAAASKGYGKNWVKFPADGKGKLPLELKKNIYQFSSAKTYAQLESINKLLYDSQGKLRPFNEFSQLAKKTGHQFNKNYLQAEYQTARTAAQMAQKWEDIQETKDLFPNLKFRTVGDSRVRDDHAKLDGVIKRIDDPFWAKYYPPLDWRCRCSVVPTAENTTTHEEKAMPKVNFKGNVGIDGEIFTKKGSFFKLVAGDENAARNMELMKLNAPYEVAYKNEKKKTLNVNIFADPKDLDDNIRIGEILVDELNTHIYIRPHLDGHLIKSVKNPEYLINDVLADRKSPTSMNYNKSLSKANKQECEIVVIDLSVNKDTVENAYRNIERILSKAIHEHIKAVYIVSADGKEVKVYERKKQP